MPIAKVKFDGEKVKIALKRVKTNLTDRGIIRMNSLLGEEARNTVVSKFLSGRVSAHEGLNRKTGTLAKSINWQIEDKKRVSIGSNVLYAPIHEFGVTITRKIRRASASKKTRPSTMKVKYPQRSFLRPGINLMFNNGRAIEIMQRVLKEENARVWK